MALPILSLAGTPWAAHARQLRRAGLHAADGLLVYRIYSTLQALCVMLAVVVGALPWPNPGSAAFRDMLWLSYALFFLVLNVSGTAGLQGRGG
eukprot:176251-Chlamydomonas_euryale.AAC.1